ncbi:hypothetical protein AB1Y20_008553 [Prymnesium parvum]|uniref:Uncharacterized protein n=1 Tax=Prymnesium parvum TaxID=97485 RepID=A0AB34ITV4_PRYPA
MVTVTVAAMNMRGAHAVVRGNALKINVTSAQRKDSRHRALFSPMHVEPYEAADGHVYACFENWWQSLKEFEGVDHATSVEWWRKLRVPKRRNPGLKGKSVLGAVHPGSPGDRVQYITSRIDIYVPEYMELLERRGATLELQRLRGAAVAYDTVAFFDFDGPRDAGTGAPLSLVLTEELFVQKLFDPTFPFGHGYVVAAMYAGFDIAALLQRARLEAATRVA